MFDILRAVKKNSEKPAYFSTRCVKNNEIYQITVTLKNIQK
jgi:hypothetical protein